MVNYYKISKYPSLPRRQQEAYPVRSAQIPEKWGQGVPSRLTVLPVPHPRSEPPPIHASQEPLPP